MQLQLNADAHNISCTLMHFQGVWERPMALFRMGQILREEESHSQSSVQSLSMPINRSNELDDALSIWIITLYHKFDCLQFTSFPASGFRNRLVYSSMEGLDEAWAVKFLFSAQHGVGTDVEGNEPQLGNFHEFQMSIFRDSAEGIESCLS